MQEQSVRICSLILYRAFLFRLRSVSIAEALFGLF